MFWFQNSRFSTSHAGKICSYFYVLIQVTGLWGTAWPGVRTASQAGLTAQRSSPHLGAPPRPILPLRLEVHKYCSSWKCFLSLSRPSQLSVWKMASYFTQVRLLMALSILENIYILKCSQMEGNAGWVGFQALRLSEERGEDYVITLNSLTSSGFDNLGWLSHCHRKT